MSRILQKYSESVNQMNSKTIMVANLELGLTLVLVTKSKSVNKMQLQICAVTNVQSYQIQIVQVYSFNFCYSLMQNVKKIMKILQIMHGNGVTYAEFYLRA